MVLPAGTLDGEVPVLVYETLRLFGESLFCCVCPPLFGGREGKEGERGCEWEVVSREKAEERGCREMETCV